ncbi:hypothetical protein AHiyo8_pI66970 (plasmid) [Arthrobacter sp. Hiyo8]|nr:hypothetical protein AHiyo8_pI66970 [Arthrobacter sp. Hiyo8]
MRGTVAAGATVDIKPDDALVAASMVVTGLPSTGSNELQEGAALVEVDGEPLIAFAWPFPAYRDIHDGDTGPDVKGLQNSLNALSLPTGTTGVFDWLTQEGVAELYQSLGYPVPRQDATTAQRSSGGAQSSSSGSNSSDTSTARGTPKVYLPARDVVSVPKSASRLTEVPLHVGQKIAADAILARLDGTQNAAIATTTRTEPTRCPRAARAPSPPTGTHFL